MLFHRAGPALQCRLDGVQRRGRALTLRLPHGSVRTPMFMPVGTQGALKGLTYLQMGVSPIKCHILLGNTYHLGNRPGGRVFSRAAPSSDAGGVHGFANWGGTLLTDSGGFQMVSLLQLASVTEQGVLFQHPTTGTRMMLTPEESVHLQHMIKSDIIMALDDVVSSTRNNTGRFRVACLRTLRWIDRCVAAHRKGGAHSTKSGPAFQNLFGILQGGLDVAPLGMREHCLAEMLKRDPALPGYAIGGLAGGESKGDFWRVVEFSTRRGHVGTRMGLPDAKPRYLMGVGYPIDIIVCSALGVDLFDSVFPTRTARFGSAFVFDKRMAICAVGDCFIKLRHGDAAIHLGAVDETCACIACCAGSRYYTRGYVNQMLARKVPAACQLMTHHNVTFMQRLVGNIRRAICDANARTFGVYFIREHFPTFVVTRKNADSGHRHNPASRKRKGVSRKAILNPGLLGRRKKKMRMEKALLPPPTSCPPWLGRALRSAGASHT